MGLSERLSGKVVALDTSPFIYFFERHESYAGPLREFFAANQSGSFLIVTSVVTLLEVLVLPLREKQLALVKNYREILEQSKGVELVSIRPEIAVRAAELRAEHGLRTPDSLQIAAALAAGADYFLTNDKALKQVTGLKVVVLAEAAQIGWESAF